MLIIQPLALMFPQPSQYTIHVAVLSHPTVAVPSHAIYQRCEVMEYERDIEKDAGVEPTSPAGDSVTLVSPHEDDSQAASAHDEQCDSNEH